MEKEIVNDTFLVQRMEGKGGWTFVELPTVPLSRDRPFGLVRVKGFVDDFEIKQFNLMPMGNGNLFLPLKAAIRKVIKKEAGDVVKVQLFLDDSVLVIPEEITLCLMDYPEAQHNFDLLTENERKQYINWIYEAKQMQTRDNRIAKMIDRLILGKSLSQPD